MEYTKAFEYISGKVEEELLKSGFEKQKVASEASGDLVSLFTGENVAYSVVYVSDRQQMVLRSSPMTDDGPANDWKTLATWLYDDETSTQKDAESIANDFLEGVSGAAAIKRAKQVRQKKKKSDDGNADPKFLAKRFVAYFPELKDEIKNEEDCYYPFRGATFAKEHIAPRVADYLRTANSKEIEKLAGVFNTQYNNGDVDTRSIITIVILNSLDDTAFSKLCEELNEDTQKAAVAARKYKGKTVAPEKPPKKRTSRASSLLNGGR
ncbi:MAG: hypothetical protein IJ598_03170 [Ruminococcus sp.]|nr:hypothetical protein [Ruminococcus sp.]